MMKVTDLWPRRASDLPPGQRQLQVFPRFSDKPLRWAPRPGPCRLDILVEGALIASIEPEDWSRFSRMDQVSDLHCVTTWTVRDLHWGGFRSQELVAEVLGDDPPPYLIARAADQQQAVFVTEDFTAEDVLLATHLNGEALERAHGAPLRLVSPSQYGYKSVKHLVALDFQSSQPVSTVGPKEHLRARIHEEERHSSLPNWMVRLPHRLLIAPTALAAERGLRRSPE